MAKEKTYSAFVSYSRRYEEWVEGFSSDLERCLKEYGDKRPVFVDRKHLAVGEPWGAQLEKALAASASLLLVITPETLASPWSTIEQRAFSAGNSDWQEGRFLPIFLVDAPLSLFTGAQQYVDCRAETGAEYQEKYRKALVEIVARLRGWQMVSRRPKLPNGLRLPPRPDYDLPVQLRRDLVEALADSGLFEKAWGRSHWAESLGVPGNAIRGFGDSGMAASALLVHAAGSGSPADGARKVIQGILPQLEGPEKEPLHDLLENFRERLDQAERERQKRAASPPTQSATAASASDTPATATKPVLKTWQTELPSEPYPLLARYEHQALFAGRDRELADLRSILDGPQRIVALYADSGAGKSSLLRAGLVDAERQQSRPVAYVDHPEDPGLPRTLIEQLLATTTRSCPASAVVPTAAELDWFLEQLQAAHRLAPAGALPLLVIDQFEHLFRSESDGEMSRQQIAARAWAGILLASTVSRSCRWILSYRTDFHGRVEAWLSHALTDAKALGLGFIASLPARLGDRRSVYVLPLFGSATSGGPNDPPEPENARSCFLAAIRRPLEVTRNGKPRYPYRFDKGGAEALAAAFAEARCKSPGLPLVPELQVALRRLIDDAAADRRLTLPDDGAAALIDRALETHLNRALHRVCPGQHQAAQHHRALFLIALRMLASDTGLRGAERSAADVRALIGAEAAELLFRLADGDLRLLLARSDEQGEVHYSLSHDSVARLIVQVYKDQGQGYGVDHETMVAFNVVEHTARLFHQGSEDEKRLATRLAFRRFALLAEHEQSWIATDPDKKTWFAACRQRCHDDLVRASAGRGLEALASLGAAGEDFELPSPNRLQALCELGPGLVGESYEEVLLEAAATLHRAWQEEDHDRREVWRGHIPTLGVLFWQLDHLQSAWPEKAETVATLREGLRSLLPAPPDPGGPGSWCAIEPGRFEMGGTVYTDEKPVHPVSVSGFRLGAHTVTRKEAGRLLEVREGVPWKEPEHPATAHTWYEAYLYAAWLGGRLPTEAEWEFACRAGSSKDYCNGNGDKSLRKVGWFKDNSGDRVHVAGERDPNNWGLYDMHGNVWEWVGDWFAPYAGGVAEVATDPWGPLIASGARVLRGGCCDNVAYAARSAFRDWNGPGDRSGSFGFRVWLPASPSGNGR